MCQTRKRRGRTPLSEHFGLSEGGSDKFVSRYGLYIAGSGRWSSIPKWQVVWDTAGGDFGTEVLLVMFDV